MRYVGRGPGRGARDRAHTAEEGQKEAEDGAAATIGPADRAPLFPNDPAAIQQRTEKQKLIATVEGELAAELLKERHLCSGHHQERKESVELIITK